MGRKAAAHTITLRKGLHLKSQPNCSTFQAHAHIVGKTYRKGMGTDDVVVATVLALEWHRELIAGELPQPKPQPRPRIPQTRTTTWQLLAKSYAETLRDDAKGYYHRVTIKRHFTPFFSKFADITLITSATINDYMLFRRRKANTEPLPQTLNRENTVLRQMLRYAASQLWIDAIPAIQFLSERQTRRRRRDFTADEYHLLRVTAIKRIKEARHSSRGEVAQAYPNRQLLYDVIQLLANSGLRVDEMRSLTWRNVDWRNGDLVLDHAGKTKSSRRLILRQAAVRALLRIAARRRRWLRERGQSEFINPAEKIISLPCGTYVRDLKKSFQGALAEAGFVYKSAQERHALTSLRHTYATSSLTKPADRRPSIHVLALQMGTSERMLNQHYGHDTVLDYRAELRG
jgi:integrase